MLAHRHRSQPLQRPDGLLRPRRGSGLADGLCFSAVCTAAGTWQEMVSGVGPRSDGDARMVASIDGHAWRIPTTTSPGIQWDDVIPAALVEPSTEKAFTVRLRFFWGGSNIGGSNRRLVSCEGGGASFAIAQYSNSSTALRVAYIGTGLTSTNYRRFWNPCLIGNSLHDLVIAPNHPIVAADEGKLAMWINGEYLADSGNTTLTWTSDAGAYTRLGRSTSAGTSIANVAHSCLQIWDRALTPAEVMALYHDPWQMLEPVHRRVWVPGVIEGGVSNRYQMVI